MITSGRHQFFIGLVLHNPNEKTNNNNNRSDYGYYNCDNGNKMKQKQKLYILIIIIVIIIATNSKVQKQSVAPDCFTKEDCKVSIPKGYCEVNYDCIVGKCYHEFILCPEQCYGGEDEDKDGLIDCDDQDCYDSPYCHCSQASFTKCKIGRCYCPEGTLPHWVVAENNFCGCI